MTPLIFFSFFLHYNPQKASSEVFFCKIRSGRVLRYRRSQSRAAPHRPHAHTYTCSSERGRSTARANIEPPPDDQDDLWCIDASLPLHVNPALLFRALRPNLARPRRESPAVFNLGNWCMKCLPTTIVMDPLLVLRCVPCGEKPPLSPAVVLRYLRSLAVKSPCQSLRLRVPPVVIAPSAEPPLPP